VSRTYTLRGFPFRKRGGYESPVTNNLSNAGNYPLPLQDRMVVYAHLLLVGFYYEDPRRSVNALIQIEYSLYDFQRSP